MPVSNNSHQRLIAVDCDGTFFNKKGYPSQQSCEVVQRLVEAGHQIVAATGRSRFSACERLVDVPAMRYAVCSNGAYVWDIHQDTLIWETVLSPEVAKEIIARLRNAYSDVAFNWEARDGFGTDELFVDLAGGIDELEVGGLPTDLCGHALYKIKVRRPKVLISELDSDLRLILGDSLCEITTSGAPFIELSAVGAHKASGLERTAELLGFTAADTMVFGDNHNDLTMFNWAGYSVAMDNAVDEIKQAATAVTLSNADHGVAHYLEKCLDAGTL